MEKEKCLYSRVKDQILSFTYTFLILSDALKYLKKHVFSDNQRKQSAAALMVPLNLCCSWKSSSLKKAQADTAWTWII